MASGAAGEGGTEEGGAPSECGVGAPPQACNAVFDGYMPPVIDFTKYSSTGEWTSVTAGGITGKTTLYHSPAAPDLVLEVDGDSLHVTGTLPPMSYAGWVWAFDGCHDGIDNLGFQFPLAGDLGATKLMMSILFNADYPIDSSSGKGACAFTSCETKSSECKAPSFEIRAADLASSLQYVGWSSFTGGAPEDSMLSPTELLGMQFELRCLQDTDCLVSLTFGRIRYFSA